MRNSHLLVFAKFVLVGAITAAIFFLAMWLAYEIFGLSYIQAVSLAYFVSTAFHFLANSLFTFLAVNSSRVSQIYRYLLLLILNYLITIFIVDLSVEGFLLSPYNGILISVLVTACVGYILGRYWVFKVK